MKSKVVWSGKTIKSERNPWVLALALVFLCALGFGMADGYDVPDEQQTDQNDIVMGDGSVGMSVMAIEDTADYIWMGIAWTSWAIILGIVLLIMLVPKGFVKKPETRRLMKIAGVLLLVVGVIFAFLIPIMATFLVKEPSYNATWKIDIEQDITTADWTDAIYTDVDLWDATEGSCNNVEKTCIVLISAVMSPSFNSANNTIAPDEILILFSVKRTDDDPNKPNNEDYANLYLQWTSSIPTLHNESDGDSAYAIKKDSNGVFYIWYYDDDDTSHLIAPGEKVSLGLFQPSQSDADLRVGFVLEPEGWGYDPLDPPKDYHVSLRLGDTNVSITLQLYAQS